MQIVLLMPSEDGNYYINHDEMIRNARDEDERKYLQRVKKTQNEFKELGYPFAFAFGLVYTQRQSCGHYEIFQHPIYRDSTHDPTEDDILESIEDVIKIMRDNRKQGRKCTRCTCGWKVREEDE